MKTGLFVMYHRELVKYFRNKQRLFVTLVQPLLFLVAFGFGIGNMVQGGVDAYIQYLLPGIIGMTILMSSTMGGMSLIWDKQFGFLKETLVAPVSRVSLLFGRALGGATTSVFQGLIVLFLGIIFMGFKITNWYLFPLAIIFMFLTALVFNLIGTTLASKFDDMHSFPMIMNLLVMPMIFISGALFPTQNFPDILNSIIKFNPFTYCVNLLRFGFGVDVAANVFLSVIVLVVLVVIIGFVGVHFFKKMDVD